MLPDPPLRWDPAEVKKKRNAQRPNPASLNSTVGGLGRFSTASKVFPASPIVVHPMSHIVNDLSHSSAGAVPGIS